MKLSSLSFMSKAAPVTSLQSKLRTLADMPPTAAMSSADQAIHGQIMEQAVHLAGRHDAQHGTKLVAGIAEATQGAANGQFSLYAHSLRGVAAAARV